MAHLALVVGLLPGSPALANRRPVVPRLVTVGLETDVAALEVPCCQGPLVVAAGGRSLEVDGGVRVESSAEVTSARQYRLQVAALKDEGQAQRLARWLEEHLAQPAEATFDAGTDLYRVRVGRYPTRAQAEEGIRRLEGDGLEAWIVTVPGRLSETGFRVTHGGATSTLAGRWLSIERSAGAGIRLPSGTYRGSVLLFLNDRGTLNVINELTLEDYLRGVVPKEMGPIVYSSLEALKAQAVAARTYTVRNLGEFEDEGYDICATPRCQVFGGMGAEHPLSDRAIRETQGQVLVYRGVVADTLYTASCGGHTEHVETVFPAKDDPYLRGVPCPERGVAPLGGGDLPRGTPLVEGLMTRLVPARKGLSEVERAETRLLALAALAGLPPTRSRLESLDRRDVRRFVGSLFDLVLDARLFTTGAEGALMLEKPPREWTEDDLRLAAYFERTGLLSAPFEGEISPSDLDEMLFQLSAYLGVLVSRDSSYLSHDAKELRIKDSGSGERLRLPKSLATFHGSEHRQRSAPLVLRPGDAVTLYLHDGNLIGLVQRVDGEVKAGTPGAKVKSWKRTHSDSHLRGMVAARYPEIDFRSFEVLERGVSGRAARIRLEGRDGSDMEVEGLAIRWTLDVPDTLFTARRVEPPGREPGWLFTGRGHGHGVGMCQLGAFGMGLRGLDYREILAHYYTDLDLVTLELQDRSRRTAGH